MLLAIVLLITTVIEEQVETAHNFELMIFLNVLFIIFLFLEERYSARIIHETLNRFIKTPKLNNLKELMKDGLYDVTVSFVYIMPFVLFIGISIGAYWVGNDRMIISAIFFNFGHYNLHIFE